MTGRGEGLVLVVESFEQFEAKAKSLLDIIEADHGGLHTEEVRQFMAVREWKLAIEILCELLLEEGRRLSENSAKALLELVGPLAIENKYWQPLIVEMSEDTMAE